MTSSTTVSLTDKKCRPCEGGVNKLSPEEARAQIESLSGWRLSQNYLRIEKHWHVKDFLAGIDFFNQVARLAEEEGHHPDLHLEGYRHVWIELWTHAIGGLSENDFIMAAKIDQLPVRLREL
jgi:4a-hydroxytetrahydrobiopterin dehydratase